MMPVAQHAYLNLSTANSPRSTAHLIEPQTFFSPVSGEKADNRLQTMGHRPQAVNGPRLIELNFKHLLVRSPTYSI